MNMFFRDRYISPAIARLAVLSLFATVTGLVPVSVTLSAVAIVASPLILITVGLRGALPPVVFWLSLFYLLVIVSTLLYDPNSFLELEFYRRDGNFILSYAPLLLLPLLAFKLNPSIILKRFLYVVILINLPFFCYYLYSNGLSLLSNDLASFGSLYVARNAAGGFLAIVTGLALVNFFYSRAKVWSALLFLTVFAMLLFTYSRGSWLGLVLGLAAFFLHKTRRKFLIGPLIIFPLAAITGGLTVWSYLNVYQPQRSDEINIGEANTVKEANIYVRLYNTWPRALQQFLASPLVGTGFGSHDDLPYQLVQIFPGLSYNAQPVKRHTDSHAHHSYLHILGEQGLLGLGVFLAFWFAIYRYLDKSTLFPMTRDFLLLTFFILTVASFTEHRITTPSNVLPFSLSLGIYMAAVNWARRTAKL